MIFLDHIITYLLYTCIPFSGTGFIWNPPEHCLEQCTYHSTPFTFHIMSIVYYFPQRVYSFPQQFMYWKKSITGQAVDDVNRSKKMKDRLN